MHCEPLELLARGWEGKEEEKYIDVVINKNMKLGQKVLIPVKQFPKEYDDGYGTAYDEQGYDSYDNSYSTQAQSGTDYYDYGHGLSEETYDSYGQEEWTNSRHKAPSARTTKGIYRDQPYARY
uniref:KH RNA binding domain containing, signal transduction associated 3 n=1 Tax=Terrapene triunguis TaxID=2587831 RepID=A0A674K162_9SAUR